MSVVIPQKALAIIEATAADHGVTMPLMMGRRRTQMATRARFDCWARLRSQIVVNGRPVSLPQIGLWFGRDHTTILNGVQRAIEVAQ